MPGGSRVDITGYREFIRACDLAIPELRAEIRSAFRDVGEVVRADAASRFGAYDAHTAAGFRVVVRQRGIAVEQSLRKTTGRHPDYGALQMRRGLLPAVAEKEPEVERRFEAAVEKVAGLF